MGNFSNARVHYGLQITGTPTKTNVLNDVFVGVSPQTVPISGAVSGYSASVILGTTGRTAVCQTLTNQWTLQTPTAQVETATAAGTITTSGNATVIVTGTRITGSPVTVSVPVLSGDTATAWATKVRSALLANTAISAQYSVGGSGTAIRLDSKNPVYGNDGTLNISLDNGTCAGITPATTSANTTAGVSGSILTNTTGQGEDFEGVGVWFDETKALLIQCISGSLTCEFTNTLNVLNLAPGGIALLTAQESENEITFTAAFNDTQFILTAIGSI